MLLLEGVVLDFILDAGIPGLGLMVGGFKIEVVSSRSTKSIL